MTDRGSLGDFMVRDPVCAYPWQPISFIRQTMLVSSFSYLPVRADGLLDGTWQLVPDYAVAGFLRRSRTTQERREALARNLVDVVKSGELHLLPAQVYGVDSPVDEVLSASKGLPVLICNADIQQLLGIVAPFDLL
jgi:hypothetical protein